LDIMSYDLAVWVGARPPTDAKALLEFRKLYEELFSGSRYVTPSEQIAGYVSCLTDHWPDFNADADADADAKQRCPWTHRPLIDNASGPLIYFSVRSSRTADVVPLAAHLAAEAGLVCFDPQTGEVR
jgi:hypothetical protein